MTKIFNSLSNKLKKEVIMFKKEQFDNHLALSIDDGHLWQTTRHILKEVNCSDQSWTKTDQEHANYIVEVFTLYLVIYNCNFMSQGKEFLSAPLSSNLRSSIWYIQINYWEIPWVLYNICRSS